MTNLGERIRNERLRRKLTVDNLSKDTKTRREHILLMENRGDGYPKEKLLVIVDYLGIQASTNEINRWYAPEPEPVDEVKELLTEIDELKAEIEGWLKLEPKGLGDWIRAVSDARKLFNKVSEII